MKTHTMSSTRFYNTYRSMKRRALNVNQNVKDFKWYKDVTICKEWMQFENFKNDMYLSYQEHVEQFGENQTTIDRIDVNKGYCKENCRWATLKEQILNRRNMKCFKTISPNGDEYVWNNQREFIRNFPEFKKSSISKILNSKPVSKHKNWTFIVEVYNG